MGVSTPLLLMTYRDVLDEPSAQRAGLGRALIRSNFLAGLVGLGLAVWFAWPAIAAMDLAAMGRAAWPLVIGLLALVGARSATQTFVGIAGRDYLSRLFAEVMEALPERADRQVIFEKFFSDYGGHPRALVAPVECLQWPRGAWGKVMSAAMVARPWVWIATAWLVCTARLGGWPALVVLVVASLLIQLAYRPVGEHQAMLGFGRWTAMHLGRIRHSGAEADLRTRIGVHDDEGLATWVFAELVRMAKLGVHAETVDFTAPPADAFTEEVTARPAATDDGDVR